MYDVTAQIGMGASGLSGINSRIDHELILGVGWSATSHQVRWWCYDKTTDEVLRTQIVTNANFDGFSTDEIFTIGDQNGPHNEACTGIYKDFSFYNRMLTEDEFKKITLGVSSLTSDELIVNCIIEMDGWKHVWGGPFDTWQDLSDDDLIDTDNYGDTGEYDFDEVLILPRFFKRYVQIHHSITTVPETCRLKESWRHYTDALDNEPDVSGTKIKFHSLADGLLDVEANTYEFGMSYGNSWRRYAYVWYGAGTGMYLGNYDSQLGTIKANWGQKYADNYMNRTDMRNDVLIESGRGLTPLKSQTLDVYIRKISTEDFSIRQEDKLIIDKALREGETL